MIAAPGVSSGPEASLSRAFAASPLLLALLSLGACSGGQLPAPGEGSDRDQDTLLDAVDECPDDAEDLDGFQDDDGCYDADNDEDGLPDTSDLCPNDTEDQDGFEDEDGCPDRDNDLDRIRDECDQCPNEPETYNGYEDDDGCPDRGHVLISRSEIVILDKIFFQRNSAELPPVSLPLVEAIVEVMRANPQILRVGIRGNAARNERDPDQLSAARAEVVLDALVARGVAPERLVAHADGHSRPIDGGSTTEAHARNRRIEFEIEELEEPPPPPPPTDPRPAAAELPDCPQEDQGEPEAPLGPRMQPRNFRPHRRKTRGHA